MKQYTSTPQHTVSATNVRMAAICPPQVSVSPVELLPLRLKRPPTARHSTDTTTPANATSRPIKPIVDMDTPIFERRGARR